MLTPKQADKLVASQAEVEFAVTGDPPLRCRILSRDRWTVEVAYQWQGREITGRFQRDMLTLKVPS